MAKYRFSNKAVEDITNIWNYTFDNWSEVQADKYYHMFLEICKEVANNPDSGKSLLPNPTVIQPSSDRKNTVR